VEYQLFPPHCRRRNAAERAIHTFKEHFVAGLASVDPDFPLHLWDRLLPQAEITLNLLRMSRQHQQLSAAAHYHGLIDYNKTAFAPPGCKIIANEKPTNPLTWAPHGQHGYSLGPAMHHYRCQNVYISATASERTVDNLEFFHHNSPILQLSSTYRLIMAANDMTNALKNHHPVVPLAQVGDDTIAALTQLAETFKNKFQKVKAPELSNAPIKAAKNRRPIVLAQPILTSPMQHKHHTRSQVTINTKGATNTPLLPRVVTPMTGWAAPPRVPTLSQNLSPRNLSQDDFWNMETANIVVALGTNHWSQQYFANAVVHPVTGKQMEYMVLMKDPNLIPGTDTYFFVELPNIPKDRKITYGKIVCD
jgi:hypothetical protein